MAWFISGRGMGIRHFECGLCSTPADECLSLRPTPAYLKLTATKPEFEVGTFEDGAAKATLTVISGTDELKGATGSGHFVADPAGRITLTLEV